MAGKTEFRNADFVILKARKKNWKMDANGEGFAFL